jgi:hypothetical protein
VDHAQRDSSNKPPIRYHGRALLFAFTVIVFPVTLANIALDHRITRWTFAPGFAAAVLVLAVAYFRWWRQGRLHR